MDSFESRREFLLSGRSKFGKFISDRVVEDLDFFDEDRDMILKDPPPPLLLSLLSIDSLELDRREASDDFEARVVVVVVVVVLLLSSMSLQEEDSKTFFVDVMCSRSGERRRRMLSKISLDYHIEILNAYY